MKQSFFKYLFSFAGILFLSSCVSIFKPVYDIQRLTIEKKQNGYLFLFSANKQIEDVKAFISQSNWLIITMTHASLDTMNIRSAFPQDIVTKIETDIFDSSVQVSLKLTISGGRVEVIRDPASFDIFINLLPASIN